MQYRIPVLSAPSTLPLLTYRLAPIKFGLKISSRGESAIPFNYQKSFNLFLSSSRPLAILDLTVPILISRAAAISS